MLKILSTESAEPRKGGVGVGGDRKAGHSQSKIDENGIDNVEIDGSEVKANKIGKKVQK